MTETTDAKADAFLAGIHSETEGRYQNAYVEELEKQVRRLQAEELQYWLEHREELRRATVEQIAEEL